MAPTRTSEARRADHLSQTIASTTSLSPPFTTEHPPPDHDLLPLIGTHHAREHIHVGLYTDHRFFRQWHSCQQAEMDVHLPV